MEFIHDLHNFWRFWSVRFGLVAAACSTSLGAYATARAIDPTVVAGIPQWALTALTVGSMAGIFASILARGVKQSKLSEKQP